MSCSFSVHVHSGTVRKQRAQHLCTEETKTWQTGPNEAQVSLKADVALGNYADSAELDKSKM